MFYVSEQSAAKLSDVFQFLNYKRKKEEKTKLTSKIYTNKHSFRTITILSLLQMYSLRVSIMILLFFA